MYLMPPVVFEMDIVNYTMLRSCLLYLHIQEINMWTRELAQQHLWLPRGPCAECQKEDTTRNDAYLLCRIQFPRTHFPTG